MLDGTEREWLRPEGMPETAGMGEDRRRASFELRPLSLGEILDRTFALYRSRFKLFASIAAVSASVQVVVQAISLTTAHTMMRTLVLSAPGPGGAAKGQPMQVRGLLAAQIGTWVAALVFFLVSAVTQAATSLAMSEVYLQQAASARAALTLAARRWNRWIGIALWQVGSMLWVPLLATVPGVALAVVGTRTGNRVLVGVGAVLLVLAVVAAFPVGFILYLRNTLAIPAAVVEGLAIRPAMRRSKLLAAGTKGRLFVVLLIAGCLYYVVAALESPASLLIILAPHKEHYLAQAITLLVSFLGHSVVAPVALIGLTLVYFDQRVRKEALDLEILLEGSRAAGSTGAETPTGGLASL